MIKKNIKILLTYLLGIILSLFLTVAFSPFVGSNYILFSVITSIITLSFIYVEMWKFGKYDELRKESSVLRAIGYMGFYIVITFFVEIIASVCNPASSNFILNIIHTIWLYPFFGFITNKTFLETTLIIPLITIALSVVAYYMGVAGVSISDKLLNARKKRIDKKAEKHFEEIEKIKEQYRKK